MTIRHLSLAGLLLAGCFGGSAPTAPSGPPQPLPASPEATGPVLALVNGLPVGTAQAEVARGLGHPASRTSFSPEEKQAYVQDAVDSELLFQEAFKLGLYQTPAIRRALETEVLRQQVYAQVNGQPPTDEEIAAWYKDHHNELNLPESVRLLHIFIATDLDHPNDPEAAVGAIREELSQIPQEQIETRFREIAMEKSNGPFARLGGDLGMVTREGRPGLAGEIVRRAFEQGENTLSEPFAVPGGWALVLTLGKREAVTYTLDESRSIIARRIMAARTSQAREAFLQRLKDEAKVRIDDKAVEAWVPASRRPLAEPKLPAEAPPPPFTAPPPGTPAPEAEAPLPANPTAAGEAP